jgi:hypothetical protein
VKVLRTVENGRRTAIVNAGADAAAGLLQEANRSDYGGKQRTLVRRALRSQVVSNVRICRALYPRETECMTKRAA